MQQLRRRIRNIVLHAVRKLLHAKWKLIIGLLYLFRQFVQHIVDLAQHELYESIGTALAVTGGNGLIVFVLKLLNLALKRNILKYGLPLGKDCRVPKPRHPAVAVRERMDKHELIMKYGGQYKGMYASPYTVHP